MEKLQQLDKADESSYLQLPQKVSCYLFSHPLSYNLDNTDSGLFRAAELRASLYFSMHKQSFLDQKCSILRIQPLSIEGIEKKAEEEEEEEEEEEDSPTVVYPVPLVSDTSLRFTGRPPYPEFLSSEKASDNEDTPSLPRCLAHLSSPSHEDDFHAASAVLRSLTIPSAIGRLQSLNVFASSDAAVFGVSKSSRGLIRKREKYSHLTGVNENPFGSLVCHGSFESLPGFEEEKTRNKVGFYGVGITPSLDGGLAMLRSGNNITFDLPASPIVRRKSLLSRLGSISRPSAGEAVKSSTQHSANLQAASPENLIVNARDSDSVSLASSSLASSFGDITDASVSSSSTACEVPLRNLAALKSSKPLALASSTKEERRSYDSENAEGFAAHHQHSHILRSHSSPVNPLNAAEYEDAGDMSRSRREAGRSSFNAYNAYSSPSISTFRGEGDLQHTQQPELLAFRDWGGGYYGGGIASSGNHWRGQESFWGGNNQLESDTAAGKEDAVFFRRWSDSILNRFQGPWRRFRGVGGAGAKGVEEEEEDALVLP